MKPFFYKLTILILTLSLYSCEKEEELEIKAPKTYMDYDNFVQDGLVAYYPFNGNADDLSRNKLNGKDYNLSFTPDRFNIERGACYFNGNNSYIKIDNSALLNSDSYTICFWYRTDLTDSLRQTVLSKSDTLSYGYSIDLLNSEKFSDLWFHYKDKNTPFEGRSLLGPLSREWVLGADRKYEFAAVAFSGNKIVDYSGRIAAEHSPAFFFNSNKFDLYIGKGKNRQNKNFKGELDDLLIYNRILTNEEIEKLQAWEKD